MLGENITDHLRIAVVVERLNEVALDVGHERPGSTAGGSRSR